MGRLNIAPINAQRYRNGAQEHRRQKKYNMVSIRDGPSQRQFGADSVADGPGCADTGAAGSFGLACSL